MIKAIRFEKTGGPEVLEYKDYDLPAPAAGQVRIKHTAIGVNFIDIYHRGGLYPLPMPSGPGLGSGGRGRGAGRRRHRLQGRRARRLLQRRHRLLCRGQQCRRPRKW